MLPRLFIARQLLRDDGLVCISIDDNEDSQLKHLLNEIFGEENFYATIVWQKKDTPSNDAKSMSTTHEYIKVYQKSSAFKRNLLPRSDEQLENYKNPDNDHRGPWIRTTLIRNEVREDRCYVLRNKLGREITPPPGTSWRMPPETYSELDADNRIWWGLDGNGDLPFVKRFLTEVQQGVVPITWWDYEFAGSNRNAKMETRGLFAGEAPFETPKPSLLMRRLMQISTSPDEEQFILDFFCGSSTTAQAVLEQNQADGGNRKFLMVQLPEPTGNHNYRTIADIGADRIRRVGARIREQNPLFKGDLGFRVFKLDSSNIRAWDPDPGDLSQTLLDSIEHVKPDRTEQDILYELLLKLGLELTVPIEPRTIAGQTVHSVGGGSLFVCLAPRIGREEVEPLAHGIAAWRDEQNPAGETEVVFRDSAFADDVARANLTAILRQRGLENVRSL